MGYLRGSGERVLTGAVEWCICVGLGRARRGGGGKTLSDGPGNKNKVGGWSGYANGGSEPSTAYQEGRTGHPGGRPWHQKTPLPCERRDISDTGR